MNLLHVKEKVQDGKPNRMLTLTVRPDPGESPVQVYRRCKPAVSRLYQRTRRLLGQFEAATFLEVHRSGYPHWHALCRCAYVQQRWLSARWEELTGSFIVDVRQIRRPEVASAYVLKYVTKQAYRRCRNALGPIVTFTRGYSFLTKSVPADDGWTWSVDPRHPLEVAECSYRGWRATWTDRTCLIIPPRGADAGPGDGVDGAAAVDRW